MKTANYFVKKVLHYNSLFDLKVEINLTCSS